MFCFLSKIAVNILMCLLFSGAGVAGSEGMWVCRFGKYGLFCACGVRYPDLRLSLEGNASREILSKWVSGSGGFRSATTSHTLVFH